MHVKTPFRQGQTLNARVGPSEHSQSPASEISYRLVPDADAPMAATRHETEKGPAAVPQPAGADNGRGKVVQPSASRMPHPCHMDSVPP